MTSDLARVATLGSGTREASAVVVGAPEQSAQPDRSDAALRWVDRLVFALLIYVSGCAIWMLAGFGGARVVHYVGLLADSPACFVSVVVAAATARYLAPGPLRSAWRCLTVALALYFAGTVIGVSSWLHGRDPFPGVADLFYVAFYPAFFAAAAFMIRAAAVRVRWIQFALDALILMVGFGAFFWYLVIRPASASTGVSTLKSALSQSYIVLNCALLLTLGVLLLSGIGKAGNRRVPLLLLVGFATMFLADILWSVGKISGSYLPGSLQDVLYVACYLPLAAAGKAQLRATTVRVAPRASDSLAQTLPYAAMLAAFLVLVSFTRGDINNPATAMTIVVFGLTLVLMVRQALVLREDALTRERRAARMVEDRYASLIANASDVIMIVTVDGALASPRPPPNERWASGPTRSPAKICLTCGRAMMASDCAHFLPKLPAPTAARSGRSSCASSVVRTDTSLSS